MVHKVALVKYTNIDMGNYNDLLAQSISEWVEITDEDFSSLKSYYGKQHLENKGLLLIELVNDEINGLIKSVLASIKKSEKEAEERDKKYKFEQSKKAEAKKKRAIEKARKLLEQEGKL